MKIEQNNLRVFAGTAHQVQEGAKTAQGGNRIFAGNRNPDNSLENRIAQKQEEARKKAQKLVGEVFAAEKSMDDDLAMRKERIVKSEQSIVEANKALAELRKEQENLKEQYGITGEEETLPEEYVMQATELERYGEPYEQIAREAQQVIRVETAIIEAVNQERLKSAPMVETAKEAEKLMESAQKEIVDMIVEEGKENIKETMEENKEKQEALEEKKEAEEAKRKEREEKQALPEVPTGQLLKLEQVKEEMKQELDTMLTEMKLIEEDIKGSMVDETL